MEEGDFDLSNPEVFSHQNISSEVPSSCSLDSFFNDVFQDTQHHACTHTHTCNPPGRDLSHTHTCFHVHTKILSAPPETETPESPADKTTSSRRRPFGNREAVRKYREKKKAHTASLEDEVIQLRALNQELARKLQGQAALEAEVGRLRCLLVDIRGRIEGEIGSFPYNRPVAKGSTNLVSDVTQGSYLDGEQVINSCDLRCDDQMYCHPPGVQGRTVGENGVARGQAFGVCDVANVQCMGSLNPGPAKFMGCGSGGIMPPLGCSSNAETR